MYNGILRCACENHYRKMIEDIEQENVKYIGKDKTIYPLKKCDYCNEYCIYDLYFLENDNI